MEDDRRPEGGGHGQASHEDGRGPAQGVQAATLIIEGDPVSIQDQTGNSPKRWSKTGRVLEALGHDSYLIKVDGSQRVTKRNRQFLRRMELFQADTTPIWTTSRTADR